MKRPLIYFTAFFALGIECIVQMTRLQIRLPDISLLLPIAMIAAGILLCGSKTRRIGVAGCALLCGIGYMLSYTTLIVTPVRQLSGKHLSAASAVVCDYPDVYDEYQRVQVKIDAASLGLGAHHPRVRAMVSIPLTSDEVVPGDILHAELTCYRPNTLDGFDRRTYYEGNGIFIMAHSGKDGDGNLCPVSIRHPDKPPVWTYPLRMAQHLKTSIATLLPERLAGITTAILIGDKSGFARQDQLALRKAGLSHVTAVSGMHVGFLVSFFFAMMGRKWGSVCSVLAILFFIPVAGASPSVIRAGIMYMIACIGFCIDREKDSLNSLSFALLVLLLANPYAAESLSLQLSFAATLGMLLFSTRFQGQFFRPFAQQPKWIQRSVSPLTTSLACSCSAMFFTTPILFASFGYVSVFAPLANLLTVPVVGILFIAGHVSHLLVSFLPGAHILYSTVLGLLSKWVLGVSAWVAGLPYGVLSWGDSYGLGALLLLYSVLLFYVVRPPHVKWSMPIPLAGIAIIVLSMLSVQRQMHTLSVSYMPSGSGQTILVAQGTEKVTLIDCSASGFRNAAQNVDSYLAWNNFSRIDTLILTSVDKTHARNAAELLDRVSVGQIIIPPNIRPSDTAMEIFAAAHRHDIPITIWRKTGESSLEGTDYLSLNNAIPRKLVVRIALDSKEQYNDILIIHSLTQKMLEQLLQQPLHGDTLVISESMLKDEALLNRQLSAIHPQEIILQSGYATTDKLFKTYPVKNTLLEGEIIQKSIVGEITEKGGG